jgi:Na+-driven multidrug efflux pump
VATLITAVLTPLYNWTLIYHYGMGLDGAAYASVLENFTDAALLVVYFLWRDVGLRELNKHTIGKWCALSALPVMLLLVPGFHHK